MSMSLHVTRRQMIALASAGLVASHTGIAAAKSNVRGLSIFDERALDLAQTVKTFTASSPIQLSFQTDPTKLWYQQVLPILHQGVDGILGVTDVQTGFLLSQLAADHGWRPEASNLADELAHRTDGFVVWGLRPVSNHPAFQDHASIS